jgi:hypothetical protein
MSPREKFRTNRSLTRGYNDLIYSNQMQIALDTAMLEYDQNLTVSHEVTTAAANRWRKEGADAYRRTLEKLNEDSPASKPTTMGQLNPKA